MVGIGAKKGERVEAGEEKKKETLPFHVKSDSPCGDQGGSRAQEGKGRFKTREGGRGILGKVRHIGTKKKKKEDQT